MRVVIVGRKWLGAAVLQRCLARGDDVVAVCAPTGGDRADRLAAAARHAAVPVVDLDGAPACEAIVAAHAHAWIGPEVRARARRGVLAYHPSLLPLHRGRDAVSWAIRMRERVTGGTVYWMTDTPDAGPIVAQRHALIRPDDTPAALWRRSLGPLGVELVDAALALLDAGAAPAVPQDESLATWEPALSRPRLAEAGGG